MTDLSLGDAFLPSRLGCTITPGPAESVARLSTFPEICNHGVVRASAVVFLVDAIAGLMVDAGSDMWSFTSDLSLRMPAAAAPEAIEARSTLVRAGRRSTTCAVPITHADGEPFGFALIGFVLIPRREDDPPKLAFALEEIARLWDLVPHLDTPMRDAVGVRALDPSSGVVEVDLRPDLLNPSGTLQGAMVAMVAEAAAEDLANHHLDHPRVVTDMDVRFVGQARVGPVRSSAAFIGPPSDGSVRVELVDTGQDDKVVTTVLARARRAP